MASIPNNENTEKAPKPFVTNPHEDDIVVTSDLSKPNDVRQQSPNKPSPEEIAAPNVKAVRLRKPTPIANPESQTIAKPEPQQPGSSPDTASTAQTEKPRKWYNGWKKTKVAVVFAFAAYALLSPPAEIGKSTSLNDDVLNDWNSDKFVITYRHDWSKGEIGRPIAGVATNELTEIEQVVASDVTLVGLDHEMWQRYNGLMGIEKRKDNFFKYQAPKGLPQSNASIMPIKVENQQKKFNAQRRQIYKDYQGDEKKQKQEMRKLYQDAVDRLTRENMTKQMASREDISNRVASAYNSTKYTPV